MEELTSAPVVGRASVRAARRLSVIWIIPVVAVAVGLWLAWNTLSKEGPTITISFEGAEGLQAGQSQLKFRDFQLGTVQRLALAGDHQHVLVTVATTSEATSLLTDTTIFWVEKPRLFAGNLSGLGTLISGSYIGMLPGAAGRAKREFVGQEDPPILEANVPGTRFVLHSARLNSVSVGSPVFFRDLDVGEVLGWDIGDMAESVTIHVFVRAPFDRYVHDETRFWNASGVSVKLAGTGVEVQLESLRALLLGGIAFDTPRDRSAIAVAAANHEFPLFSDRDAAEGASYSRKISLVSYFTGSIRGLAPGAEVTLRGLTVGHVTAVGLTFDPTSDTVVAPVHFEIEPERVIGIGKRAFATVAEGVDALLKSGLRASLQSGNLLTGQQLVVLEFVPGAPPATVTMDGTSFVVPATNGGGLSSLTASAGELLAKVNTIPFDAIGKSLAGLTQNLDNITGGPEVKQVLASAASTLASAQDAVQDLDKGLAPAAKRLPDIAAGLQKTLTDANGLMVSVGSAYGDNTRFERELERLLVQVNDALRSIQALSDLLTRHPEALVKGRPQGGVQ
jgi:paraquat-inducible protein B